MILMDFSLCTTRTNESIFISRPAYEVCEECEAALDFFEFFVAFLECGLPGWHNVNLEVDANFFQRYVL